jgi:RNA polymerase sigma-70 factor (ECF subfamily)
MAKAQDESPKLDFAREQRFLQLFLAHERRIYGFILALVPNWSDADDLLQETSAVLWRKLDDFEPGTDFLAWALSIARFQVLNYRKKQRQLRARLSDRTVETLVDQLMALGERSDARRDALAECLAKLNSRDRELIQLRYQPEATTQRVADCVGRSLKAVYKALNRIHGQLLLCIRQTLASEAAT